MTNLNAEIKTGSLWIGINFAVASILGLITMPLIVKCLSVEQYGIYNLLFSLTGYIAVFSAFGITNAFQRFIPEANQKNDIGFIKNFVAKGLLLKLLLSSVAVVVLLIFSEEVGELFKYRDWHIYFSYFGVGIIIFLEISSFNAALQGMFFHSYISKINTICTLMRTVGILFVFFMNKGLHGILYVEIIIWTINLGLLFSVYYLKFLKPNRQTANGPIPFKRIARYSGYSFFSEIGFAIFSSSTDLIIISIFLGPFYAGLYGLCDRILRVLKKILPNTVLKQMILPVFFTLYSKNRDPQQLHRMFNFLVKIEFFFALPIVLIFCILGEKVIPVVFGAEYQQAYATMCVVAVSFALNSLQEPVENVLRAVEKVDIIFKAQIFSVVNLIGDLLVVEHYGILGVALVTSLSVFIKNLYCFYHAHKHTGISFNLKWVVTTFINSSFLLIFFYFMQNFIDNLHTLIVVLVSGAFIYLTSNYLNSIFDENEKIFLNKILPFRLWKTEKGPQV